MNIFKLQVSKSMINLLAVFCVKRTNINNSEEIINYRQTCLDHIPRDAIKPNILVVNGNSRKTRTSIYTRMYNIELGFKSCCYKTHSLTKQYQSQNK